MIVRCLLLVGAVLAALTSSPGAAEEESLADRQATLELARGLISHGLERCAVPIARLAVVNYPGASIALAPIVVGPKGEPGVVGIWEDRESHPRFHLASYAPTTVGCSVSLLALTALSGRCSDQPADVMAGARISRSHGFDLLASRPGARSGVVMKDLGSLCLAIGADTAVLR